MHETNKEELTTAETLGQLRKLNDKLEHLIEVNMAMLIQLSKLYDITVATAVGANNDQIEQILDNHEKGLMASTEPVLRGFAAPDDE